MFWRKKQDKCSEEHIDTHTLFDMIAEAHSLQELRDLYVKNKESFDKAWGVGIVLEMKIRTLKINAIEKRLGKVEQEIFGMTYDEAESLVDSYVAAVQKNPDISASEQVLKAEKMLGV